MMREQQIETLRKRETEVETRLKMLRERKKQLQDTIEQSKKDVELYNKVSNLLINTSLAIQKQTTERIAQIVTDLYQYVFMTDDRFVIKVDAKRSTPIAQFFIETTKDGEKLLLNPLKSDGGGKVDVIALGLRLAALLLYKPALERVLILDEPFVGLDPKASLVLKNKMHELCENGSAIFFSTHVLDVAEKLCNKVAIIRDGKLVASKKTEELLKGASLEDVFMEVTDHVETN